MYTPSPSRLLASLVLPSTVTVNLSPKRCTNPTWAIRPMELKYIPNTSPGRGKRILSPLLCHITFCVGNQAGDHALLGFGTSFWVSTQATKDAHHGAPAVKPVVAR